MTFGAGEDAMEEMSGLAVNRCERCPALVRSRSRIVNGVGADDAALLFVGEAPGEREDAQGEPFVGRSGAVLDEALRDNGLARDDVRITNCVRCRPPDNRDPTGEELGHCRGYLEAEILEVDPAVLVTLGKVPSEHLLGRDVAITSEAGSRETIEVGGDAVEILLCVHPAATLYDGSQRAVFDQVIKSAASLAGAGDQTTLGSFPDG